jgi:carbon-monoxide dehydrogenase medium subunit
MKWPAFGYARPTSLDELWPLLGDGATVLAGGQSLLATLAFRLSDPQTLVDITRIAPLRGVTVAGGVLRLGALTRHAELSVDPLIARHAPMLAEAAPLIAHPAIRNRGTIGGSLAMADPAAELPACVVALEASLILASAAGERRVAAAGFFTGAMSTALRPGEIIAAIEIPSIAAGERQRILEITRRSGDYAMAGLAARWAIEGGTLRRPRLVLFGVGGAPTLAQGAMVALDGKPLSEATLAVAQAALATDLDPPADLHGPPEMKRHLARVLLQRALLPAEAIAA